MASDKVKTVTDGDFGESVKSGLVLVDFWAEWCAPCRAIAPIIKDLAARYGDQVKIVKMNIDENPGTPGTYGVRAIPTVLAFRSGAVVEQITGAKPKKSFEEMVEKLLA
jgi:thioredoxin 1